MLRKSIKINQGKSERRADDLREKRKIKKRFSRNLTKTEQLVKVGEVGDQTKKLDAPSTSIKNYGKMGFQKFFGGTRVGKVRPKPGLLR